MNLIRSAALGGAILLSAVLAFAAGPPVQASTAGSTHFIPGFLQGAWTVEVEGEKRLRRLAVFQPGPASAAAQRVAAVYGWADAELNAVKATASIADGKVELELVTPASSVIKVHEVDPNSLSGTFRANFFSSKAVTLKREEGELVGVGSTFAQEDADYRVEPTQQMAVGDYHRPTPLTVPGAKTITTGTLWAWLTTDSPPAVIDVMGGTPGKRVTVPTAIWGGSRFAAADAEMSSRDQEEFARMLTQATRGDKAAAVVFLCLDSHCWMSYNAALRAVRDGYTSVWWYRGGWTAWHAARLPVEFAQPWTGR